MLRPLHALAGIATACTLLTPPIAAAPPTQADLLGQARAAYAALKSYSDTGTVETEFGPKGASLRERHAFTTYYRAPRHFYFDFVKQGKTDRFVVWAEGQAFHSWWQATQVTEEYPQGRGANAFTAGDQPTLGSVQLIAALLFQGAGLGGTITEFGDATDGGVEAVSGRQCRKLVGTAKTVYRTGRAANIRPTTIWVDAETHLVRRVLEEAAQGTAPNYLNRRVTTIEPQANPPVEDAKFAFTPPKSMD